MYQVQFTLNGRDYGLILRVDDEGQEFIVFELFDNEYQETVFSDTIGA